MDNLDVVRAAAKCLGPTAFLKVNNHYPRIHMDPANSLTSTTISKDIGIIGAGPAGLAALKAILDSPQYKAGIWKPTAFEAREQVGGVWLPSPSTNPGDAPPPTPLYDSLTTNLPHPIMGFPSFPFPHSTPLFPPAATVESYLSAYATHFNLGSYIQLNTRVTDAVYNPASLKWVVRTESTASTPSHGVIEPSSREYEFDLLLVCNGHYNLPRYPRTVPGLPEWLASGRAIHSKFYRNPSSAPYALDGTHTVLVVGGGPSGLDIVSDISHVVKRVIHSSSPASGADEGNVKRRGRLVRFLDEGRVELEGGIVEDGIDYCILATGYEVSFPFFTSSADMKDGTPSPVPPIPKELWNTSYGVYPLARYIFPFSLSTEAASTHSAPPTRPIPIAFLGLLVRVSPMPVVEVQALAALAAFANAERVDWTGETTALVRRYEELKAITNLEDDKNKKETEIHKAFFRFEPMEQFDYRDELVEFATELEGAAGREGLLGNVSHVRQWERDLYAQKDILRRTWRALEASGEAEEWVRDVGAGKSGRSGEEEWVELMWKVVRKGEEGGDRQGDEERVKL